MKPAKPFSDRSSWIAVFGVVEIGLGLACLLLCALLLALAAFGPSLGARGAGLGARTVGSSLAVYLTLATFFVWMGIGTLRKRRWARTLMLSSSWIWLAVGVFGMGIWFLVLLPGLNGLLELPADTEGAGAVTAIVGVVATLFMTIVYVVLPLAFVLFLRSPGVRQSFEIHDPVPRWTDRCSAGVLSMILTLAYGAFSCLYALTFDVVPFFGILLRGLPAAALLVASAAALAWLAYGFYELRPGAWWGTLLFTLLWTVSSVLTFLRAPIEDVYRAAGIDAEQLETLRGMGLASPSFLVGVTLASALTVVAYLVFLRKEFRVRLKR